MKVIRTGTSGKGKRTVTVELEEGEKLMAFRDDGFYRLGYPADDVIYRGNHITESEPVEWCVVGQKWES